MQLTRIRSSVNWAGNLVFSNRRMSLKGEGAGGEGGSFQAKFFLTNIAVVGRWECGNRAAISKVVGKPRSWAFPQPSFPPRIFLPVSFPPS